MTKWNGQYKTDLVEELIKYQMLHKALTLLNLKLLFVLLQGVCATVDF